jgi:hypothetical protein
MGIIEFLNALAYMKDKAIHEDEQQKRAMKKYG